MLAFPFLSGCFYYIVSMCQNADSDLIWKYPGENVLVYHTSDTM